MTENNSTEVVQYDDGPGYHDVIEPTTPALRRLEAEALAMDKAVKLARGLSMTQMVPPHFQQSGPRGENATWDLAAAILYGAELGLSAPQSAQNVFVVKGKPAVYARTMAAQVMAAADRRPDPTAWGIQEVEASDQAVVWKAWRDGKEASTQWTIERAQQAGYTANAKYQSNPTEMLRAKCIAEVCRILFPDVLLGMAYTVEELQLENITVQRMTKQGARGTAKLREIAEARQDEPVQPSEAEPQVVEEAAMPVAEETPQPPSNAQLTEIRKLYKAQGVTGQAILDDLSEYFQRVPPLGSLNDLSHDEAAGVISWMKKPPEGDHE
jgi:hypothetical protein